MQNTFGTVDFNEDMDEVLERQAILQELREEEERDAAQATSGVEVLCTGCNYRLPLGNIEMCGKCCGDFWEQMLTEGAMLKVNALGLTCGVENAWERFNTELDAEIKASLEFEDYSPMVIFAAANGRQMVWH